MKNKILSKISISIVLLVSMIISNSCINDLLDQEPTTELGATAFWKTEEDATTALMGAYGSIRWCFDRDYYYEGHGEYVKVRGNSTVSGSENQGDAYNGASFLPNGYGNSFDKMYRYLFGGVNRANYVIDNVKVMLSNTTNESSIKNLEKIIGEARLLRGMVYFRLISLWGDVPYLWKTIYGNEEVENISRMSIAQIKDSIMADFTYAIEKLPDTQQEQGRATKPAALAFRGKLQLYWACWNKFGWPELPTFTSSTTDAEVAYRAAAADFKRVITDFGLTLFRNGEPGEWGTMGNAEILPNYFYLFLPTANGDPEIIMSFNHGKRVSNQSERVMQDLGGRNHQYAQAFVSPYTELADRYQSTITGDFCPKLIPMNPETSKDARTAENSMVNPESYRNRDYRMKATLMWDYEMSLGMNTDGTVSGWIPFIYKTWGATITFNGETYTTWLPANTAASNGYAFRKFIRNYAESGNSGAYGDYSWPVMRLADVFLMYAEASNEAYGPLNDAIELVNKIRRRGNLPPLKPEKTATKEAFFDAIEQERIVELVGEGHRGFDLRRWRAIERVWCPPYGAGLWRIDTWGANINRYFQNSAVQVYERCYIFRIPPNERDRNPNLTQNVPWM